MVLVVLVVLRFSNWFSIGERVCPGVMALVVLVVLWFSNVFGFWMCALVALRGSESHRMRWVVARWFPWFPWFFDFPMFLNFECVPSWLFRISTAGFVALKGQRESSDALGHGPVAPVVLVVLRFPNVFEFWMLVHVALVVVSIIQWLGLLNRCYVDFWWWVRSSALRFSRCVFPRPWFGGYLSSSVFQVIRILISSRYSMFSVVS